MRFNSAALQSLAFLSGKRWTATKPTLRIFHKITVAIGRMISFVALSFSIEALMVARSASS